MPQRLIDLSHEVEHGMITYKGLPAPIICDYLSRDESRNHYASGTEFNIGRIDMVANTGTYVDSPFHRFADGMDLSELPLESLVDLDGVVVHVQEYGRTIPAAAFDGVHVAGKAVLIHTGWSRHWRTDQYFEGHPFLAREAAQYLAEAGAAFVGIDTYNIDDTTDGTRPAHTHHPAGQSYPDLRAHVRAGKSARSRIPLSCCAGQGQGIWHLPGKSLRSSG